MGIYDSLGTYEPCFMKARRPVEENMPKYHKGKVYIPGRPQENIYIRTWFSKIDMFSLFIPLRVANPKSPIHDATYLSWTLILHVPTAYGQAEVNCHCDITQ